MTRLRLAFSLALVLVASVAVAQPKPKNEKFSYEPPPAPNRAFDEEVTKVTAAILTYSDADGNGALTYPEYTKARTQVIEEMVEC